MQYEQLKYVREEQDPSLTIETERLVVKVIDNTGLRGRTCRSQPYFRQSHVFTPFTHHLGYHGIRTLYDKAEKRNLVVPFVSWLNLQAASLAGIDPDPVDERACYGMGRGWPIRMEKKGNGAILRLDPMPSMQMRYSLELAPAEPDGIDFSIRFELAGLPAFRRSRGCTRPTVTKMVTAATTWTETTSFESTRSTMRRQRLH